MGLEEGDLTGDVHVEEVHLAMCGEESARGGEYHARVVQIRGRGVELGD